MEQDLTRTGSDNEGRLVVGFANVGGGQVRECDSPVRTAPKKEETTTRYYSTIQQNNNTQRGRK